MIYLNTNSRRARQRLAIRLGRSPDYYYTFDRGGRFAGVTEEEAIAALGAPRIPGISRARFAKGETPAKCWGAWG